MPEGHRDGHAKGRLGLVDGAEGALVVDVGGVGLDVLAALLLVAGKGGDGEGRARGMRGGAMRHGRLFGRVCQRQCGRGCPLMRGRCLGSAIRCVCTKRGGARPSQLGAEIADGRGNAVTACVNAVRVGVLLLLWRCGRIGGCVGGHVHDVVLHQVELRRRRQGEGGRAVCGGALEYNRGRLAVCLALAAKEGGASREEALR